MKTIKLTTLLTHIALALLVAATSYGTILPSDRATTWNPGLNAVGGIPNRTTIFQTLQAANFGNGTIDASNAIQTALDNCPEGQVVQLSAGTFLANSYLIIQKELP
jgi:polygalacturonase